MRAGEAMKHRGGESVQLRRRLGHADLSAVGDVRRDLREFLRYRSPAEAAEVAELLLSEIVTNALIHTRHGAVVTVTAGPEKVRVEVRDFMSDAPRPYVPNADDGTHGRGLVLVRSLADAWGVTAQALGKVVWFELSGTG